MTDTDSKVEPNRKLFLSAMRNGEYKKGTILADEKGRPIIKGPEDHGFCAVGLMHTLFEPVNRCVALNITNQQCSKIQHDWNDSSLTFPQIADLIELEIFN